MCSARCASPAKCILQDMELIAYVEQLTQSCQEAYATYELLYFLICMFLLLLDFVGTIFLYCDKLLGWNLHMTNTILKLCICLRLRMNVAWLQKVSLLQIEVLDRKKEKEKEKNFVILKQMLQEESESKFAVKENKIQE